MNLPCPIFPMRSRLWRRSPTRSPPLADIPEPDVPLATVPQTGDASLIWLGLSLMSGLSLAGLILLGKKKED